MYKEQRWINACLELSSSFACSDNSFDQSLRDEVLDGAFHFSVRYTATALLFVLFHVNVKVTYKN